MVDKLKVIIEKTDSIANIAGKTHTVLRKAGRSKEKLKKYKKGLRHFSQSKRKVITYCNRFVEVTQVG